MTLPGVARPSTRLTPGVDDRDVDAVAGVARVPQGRRARVGGRVGHRVDVGSGVVAAGQRGGRDDGRGEEDGGQRAAESAGAREVQAPAAVGRGSVRGDGSALVSRSTCAINSTFWIGRCAVPGNRAVFRSSRSGEIPGFASPPFDGFAEFADRLATTEVAVVLCPDDAWPSRRGQWEKSPVRCLPEPEPAGAQRGGQPASAARPGRTRSVASWTERSPPRMVPLTSSVSIPTGSSGRAK